MRSLYLCYFGLLEPLVQTQVLPYLREISAGGIAVNLLTFEPNRRRAWSAEEEQEWRDRLAAEGIRWFVLPYHKRPSLPATLYDILAGAWFAFRLIRTHKIDVLHARTHVPMAMALLARSLSRCRVIFDIRGMVADEYVDAGIWAKSSPTYRTMKWLERLGLHKADQLVVLTQKMKALLIEQSAAPAEKIEVIPCCVDLSRFSDEGDMEKARRFEVVYAGSVTGVYLLDEMARFFLALQSRRPDAFFRILTTAPPELVSARLEQLGLSREDYGVASVSPTEVSHYLRRAHLGLSFRKQTFSQIAASPTKIPEYLMAGLPVVTNAGIGDTDDLLENAGVGVVVRAFTPEAYAEAAEKALALAADPELKERCVRVAGQRFDLAQVGGAGYLRVYRRIGESLSLSRAVAETT
ncbi:MAG TPA: glycosyltransferase family 4 protein [Blastocatellia bacterium]|nr:glycosyltransferase family 4 protein [Blastocatellia bacterium]